MNKQQSPLKIGYVWQYDGFGESTTSASALHIKAVKQGFEQRGHQVRIITFQGEDMQWSEDLETWHTVEIERSRASDIITPLEKVIRSLQGRLNLPFFRFFDSYHFTQGCISALAECDVLYERFWLMASGGLMAARRLGIPLIYEVNGDLVEEYSLLGIKLSPAQWRAIHFVTRIMFQQAGRVVTVSEPLRAQTIKRWRLDEAQVVTVNNGAHVDLFANAVDTSMAKARYHLNGDPVVMFVGSFKPWHGLELLVDAFNQAADQCISAKLMLVGDGPTRVALEAQVKSLNIEDRVIFTGRIDHQDVAELLGNAEIAVVNPRVSQASQAQSPLKLFEYMAAGKAIVAPDIQNIQQILTHQENGLLIPPNNTTALAEAMTTLLDNAEMRRRLGENARKDALEKHSWGRVAAELEAIMVDELNKLRKTNRA